MIDWYIPQTGPNFTCAICGKHIIVYLRAENEILCITCFDWAELMLGRWP